MSTVMKRVDYVNQLITKMTVLHCNPLLSRCQMTILHCNPLLSRCQMATLNHSENDIHAGYMQQTAAEAGMVPAAGAH